jgi:hypothetical protein
MKATSVLLDPQKMFHPDNCEGLNHLLHTNLEDDMKIWNAEVSDAYETTIAYLGGVKLAIAARAKRIDIYRRLVAFPMFVRTRFIELVAGGQLRALAILCHYFAMLTELKEFWYIANTGEREVNAIAKTLPERWQESIAWAKHVLEEPASLTPGTVYDLPVSPEDFNPSADGVLSSQGVYVTSLFRPDKLAFT